MINHVRNTTPPTRLMTYHRKMSHFSASDTLSSPQGEESGALQWSVVEGHQTPNKPEPSEAPGPPCPL
jgi:hypothetical protein